MRKLLWLIVCLMTMVVSANAHNVHYPTYTEDGITYVATSRDKQGNFTGWDVLEVNKPYDRTITIPYMITIDGREEKVHRIRANAFAPCVSLDSLIVSDGLYLGEETFIGCKELEYIYYSSNTSAWGPNWNKYTYYPDLSVKTLETNCGVLEDTFWKSILNSLEKLIIRDTSKTIFARFYDCKKLKTIICYAIEPPSTWNTKSVYSYGGTCGLEKFSSKQWETITLYVPRESLEKYYFSGTWGVIDNIYAIDEMAETPTSINSTTNSITMDSAWYSLNGTKVDNPTKGAYIKNGKKYIVK